ncbi:MAG: segregation ATPase FtsK/SpoIIIE, family [Blastocatellia bacterium]
MPCASCGKQMITSAPFCPFCGQPAQRNSSNESYNPTIINAAPGGSPPVEAASNSATAFGNGAATRRAFVEDADLPTVAVVDLAQAPDRMRELLRYLRSEVIQSCQKAIARAAETRETSLKRIQADRDRARAILNQRRNASLGVFNQAKTQHQHIEAELHGTAVSVHEHFRKDRVAIPSAYPTQPAWTGSVAPYDQAANCLGAAKASVIKLTKIHRPEWIWWRPFDLIGALMIAAVTAAVIMGIVQPVRADDVVVPMFLIIVIVSVGLLAAIGVLRKNGITSKLAVEYANWAQARQAAQFWLESFQAQTEDQYRQAVVAENLFEAQADKQHRETLAAADQQHQQALAHLRQQYSARVADARRQCSEFIMTTGFAGADWNDSAWSQWQPVVNAALAVGFGKVGTGSADLRPALEMPALSFSIPALISFMSGRCVLFEATGEAKKRAVAALHSFMLRMLATIPPGKLRFTLIDPVGLGDNVAAFMPLADYDKDLITSKAWTEPQHIEKRLAEITEHMETVIQKFLRNKFPTIEDYNQEAGEVAEPYRALVVVDFPVNFTDTAARRLVSIAQNGPRCGVHTFVVMDTAKPKPHGFNLADLERAATVITFDSTDFVWQDPALESYPLTLDSSPPKEIIDTVVKRVGQMAKSGMKVEVPYAKLLDMARADENNWWRDGLWSGNTSEEIKVPLGPTGARKPHYLTLGTGTAIHSLVIGRTGSGKSNLMHVIIMSLALAYSPDEMQLYLIDFKQGVEFKPYAEQALPHAKVIAIESEREFGMSVLQGLDEELRQRGEIFRAAGVEKISNYRRKTGAGMPRILLMVDEFQEFFSQDDQISRQASLILDRLVRQGRSSGIHVMLGSQTLGGSSPLSRSTLGQMNVRIALQCSEADSRLILAEDNPAARLLSRPGEAYYNDQGGLVEGNTLFQVALFTDKDRSMYLETVHRMASGRYARPIVFEGNKPARLEDCKPLNEALAAPAWPQRPKAVNAWLGEAIALRPPAGARFRRQSGNNLLIITRDEAEGVGMLVSSIFSIAAQQSPEAAQFCIIDFSTADSEWANLSATLAARLPHRTRLLARRELPERIAELAAEVQQRLKAERVEGPEIYFIVQGLHRARDLRPEESGPAFGRKYGEEKRPSANELFMTLLREGPDVGIHTIAWSDTLTNALRVERRLLTEISLRVGGAMSNEDSTKLLDDAAAAKLDKPHRAFFADEERPGLLEKFRPYAIPESDWLEWAAAQLRARTGHSDEDTHA